MSNFALRAVIEVPSEWKVGKLNDIADACNAHGSVYNSYNPTKRKITLIVGDPRTLENAPSGSHDFARGWIMHAFIKNITMIAGRALSWEEVEYDFSIQRILKESGKHHRLASSA